MEFYYLIVVLSFMSVCSPNGEIVTYVIPENCSDREYYAPSIMSCILCDNHQRSSLDRKYNFLIFLPK